MVVLYRDAVRVTVGESKGESPTRIHRHRPHSLSRAGQRMEPHRLQLAERLKRRCGVKGVQEHQRPLVVEPAKPSAPVILE